MGTAERFRLLTRPAAARPQIHNEGFRSFCIWFGRIEYRADEAMSKQIDEKADASAMSEGGGGATADGAAAGSKLMESGRRKLSYASYLWTNRKVRAFRRGTAARGRRCPAAALTPGPVRAHGRAPS